MTPKCRSAANSPIDRQPANGDTSGAGRLPSVGAVLIPLPSQASARERGRVARFWGGRRWALQQVELGVVDAEQDLCGALPGGGREVDVLGGGVEVAEA